MTSKAKAEFQQLQKAGEDVFERIVEFPFWDEYGDQLKSDIADLSNIGGRYAGAITAGKFLENFADAPYIHLDIAGPAYMAKKWNYWPKGGTGVGVRLFYQFVKSIANK
jgi:leucyl aminopeptidase